MNVHGWASTAPNGRRYHAIIKHEPWEYETACGQTPGSVDLFYDEEPDWNVDVPSPPKKCPNCARVLKLADLDASTSVGRNIHPPEREDK